MNFIGTTRALPRATRRSWILARCPHRKVVKIIKLNSPSAKIFSFVIVEQYQNSTDSRIDPGVSCPVQCHAGLGIINRPRCQPVEWPKGAAQYVKTFMIYREKYSSHTFPKFGLLNHLDILWNFYERQIRYLLIRWFNQSYLLSATSMKTMVYVYVTNETNMLTLRGYYTMVMSVVLVIYYLASSVAIARTSIHCWQQHYYRWLVIIIIIDTFIPVGKIIADFIIFFFIKPVFLF